jgi:diguanylate cyclase (GGDEF)-like protein/PAS domain S-box-containing protein
MALRRPPIQSANALTNRPAPKIIEPSADGPDAAARNQLMFDATDVIVVSNADAVFTYVSPGSLPLLGYAPEELLGRPVARFVHPADRALVGVAQTRPARNGEARIVTLRYRRKDGSYAWVESRSKSLIDPGTGTMSETQAVLRDIGERKEAQFAIERQALRDALTGLANRVLLSDRLTQSLKRLTRTPGLVGVLMLDLDHFKVINDTLGHQTGDAVLVAAARRMNRLARPDDTVARFGGDEFVVVVQGLTRSSDLTAFADRMVAGLREPYRVGKQEIVTTVSIGIATASRPDYLPADLLRQADLALYRAKDRGRDRHEIYGEALQVTAIERLDTERLIRRALAEQRLALEYQPVVDLPTGVIVAAEALLRIDDADLGRVTAERFLSVAEETGLLATMDKWVRVTALSQLAAWRANSDLRTFGRVAINVTARELASADFVSQIATLLGEHGLTGHDLAIEVTEHVLLQSSNSAISSLVNLRELGVQIGLDDFGTGFSPLSYLQTFPLDFLKIDRSFIERVVVDKRSSSIVAAITGLAHALGLTVVAEGIETSAQLAKLRSLGCDRGQGHAFSKTLAARDFATQLQSYQP